MIGKMILSILCFLIFSMLFAFAEEYAFRQTKWGITKEEVENSEYSKLIGDYEDNLIYKAFIFDFDCDVYYFFEDGKLRSAEYNFGLFEPIENARYVYNSFKEILIKKYGIPLEEKEKLEKWDNIWMLEYGIIPERAYHETKWENDTTLIILKIHDRWNPYIFINYFDKKWLETDAPKKAQEREHELYKAF